MINPELIPASYYGINEDESLPDEFVGTSRMRMIVEMATMQFAPITGPKGHRSEAEIKGQTALALGAALNMAHTLGVSHEETGIAFDIGMTLGQKFKGRYRFVDQELLPEE